MTVQAGQRICYTVVSQGTQCFVMALQHVKQPLECWHFGIKSGFKLTQLKSGLKQPGSACRKSNKNLLRLSHRQPLIAKATDEAVLMISHVWMLDPDKTQETLQGRDYSASQSLHMVDSDEAPLQGSNLTT